MQTAVQSNIHLKCNVKICTENEIAQLVIWALKSQFYQQDGSLKSEYSQTTQLDLLQQQVQNELNQLPVCQLQQHVQQVAVLSKDASITDDKNARLLNPGQLLQVTFEEQGSSLENSPHYCFCVQIHTADLRQLERSIGAAFTSTDSDLNNFHQINTTDIQETCNLPCLYISRVLAFNWGLNPLLLEVDNDNNQQALATVHTFEYQNITSIDKQVPPGIRIVARRVVLSAMKRVVVNGAGQSSAPDQIKTLSLPKPLPDSEVLRNWLQMQQKLLVHQGMVIQVSRQTSNETKCECQTFRDQTDTDIYFKVVQVSAQQEDTDQPHGHGRGSAEKSFEPDAPVLADVNSTNIYIKDHVRGLIPAQLSANVLPQRVSTPLCATCSSMPSVHYNTSSTMADVARPLSLLLLPYFYAMYGIPRARTVQGSHALDAPRLSVLLTPPPGPPPTAILNYSAKALGVSIVHYNWHELFGPGDVAGRLHALREVVQQLGPGLLVLQAVNRAGGANEGMGMSSGAKHGLGYNIVSAMDLLVDAASEGGTVVIGTTKDFGDVPTDVRRVFTHELCLPHLSPQQRETALHTLLQPYIPRAMWTRVQQDMLSDLASFSQSQLAQLVHVAFQCCAQRDRDATGREGDHVDSMLQECDVGHHIHGALSGLRVSGTQGGTTSNGGETPVLPATSTDPSCNQTTEPRGDSPASGKHVQNRAKLRTRAPAPPGAQLTFEDLQRALHVVLKQQAIDLGTPCIPNVTWDDVGGLQHAKQAILSTVQLPRQFAQLFKSGIQKRSGVLLYGPPGSGKTLIAKAVATSCKLSFLNVKGPELLNQYVGESERLVRELFKQARAAKPCLIFFDELDALAPARGVGAESGGVMDRLVSSLLAEIDNSAGENADVYILAATNRPDLLDTSLLRPGRLDKLVYVSPPTQPEGYTHVLKACTRKFVLSDGVDLVAVAEQCPPGCSGADLFSVASDAWMVAVKDYISSKCVGGGEEGEDDVDSVTVSQGHLVTAARGCVPSVDAVQMQKYEALRQKYEG